MEQLTPYVYYAGKASREVADCSRQMAQQVDVPARWCVPKWLWEELIIMRLPGHPGHSSGAGRHGSLE